MGGKQGGIFEEWFKNIASMIFLQSFHAIFLAFVCEIIAEIVKVNNKAVTKTFDVNATTGEGVLAIMTIVSIMSLIKMEKMVKGIFGIKDSKFLGGLGENFSKSMAAIGSGISMAKRTAEPFKEAKQKREVKQKAGASVIDSRAKRDKSQSALDAIKAEGASMPDGGKNDVAYQIRLNRAQDKFDAADKSVKENEQAYKEAKSDLDVANQKKFLRAGSTASSLGVGIGATDNIGSAVTVANAIDAPLDMMSDRWSKRTGYGKASKEMEEEINSKKEAMARERVRSSRPGLSESSAAFRREVENTLASDDFQKEANKKLSPEIKAKLEIDMKLPKNQIIDNAKDLGKDWLNFGQAVAHPVTTARNGGTTRDIERREGRAQARKVAKNGIVYKDQNLDDVL